MDMWALGSLRCVGKWISAPQLFFEPFLDRDKSHWLYRLSAPFPENPFFTVCLLYDPTSRKDSIVIRVMKTSILSASCDLIIVLWGCGATGGLPVGSARARGAPFHTVSAVGVHHPGANQQLGPLKGACPWKVGLEVCVKPGAQTAREKHSGLWQVSLTRWWAEGEVHGSSREAMTMSDAGVSGDVGGLLRKGTPDTVMGCCLTFALPCLWATLLPRPASFPQL